MRKSLTVFLLVFCGCASFSDPGTGPIDRSDMPLRYNHVRGNIHTVEDFNYWKTNSVIYAHPDGIVIIDSTWSPKTASLVLWHAATLSFGNFLGLIITEYPLYRSGGAGVFKASGVEIFAQTKTARRMVDNWDAMQRDMRKSFSSWRGTEALQPDTTFDRELRLLDGKIIAIYPGDAHAPGNTVIYFPEEKVLYGGSLISSPPMFLENASPAKYREVMDQILKLDFDLVICGHGKTLEKRDIISRMESEIAAHYSHP